MAINLAASSGALQVQPAHLHPASTASPARARRRYRSVAASRIGASCRGVSWTPAALAATASVATAASLKRGLRPQARGQRGASVALGSGVAAREVGVEADASSDADLTIRVGTNVKVIGENITFFHAPGFRGLPYNPKGLVGTVVSVIKGEHLTANRPFLVKLQKAPDTVEGFKAFAAHFSEDEISAAEAAEEAAAVPSKIEDVAGGDSVKAASQAVESRGLEDDRWEINLLYDGACPSCMMQVEFLQKRMDENPEYQGIVKLTDLQRPDYDPELCGGVVFEDGMRHIHAVTRKGEVIVGMDVFRRIYSIVGMQWVYEITMLPIVGSIFDTLYDWFAEYRLRAAGREDILDQVRQRKLKIQELSETECEMECEVDWDDPKYFMPETSPNPIRR